MFPVLDRSFNVAVLHIASRLFPCGFDVGDHAPETYEQLMAHIASTGRMLVFSGGSSNTIYGDEEVNYAFRAWHDWCHWRGRFRFDSEGETLTGIMQSSHIFTLYGDTPDSRKWSLILHAEVIGQNEYFSRHRKFPDNQRRFVIDYLENQHNALRTYY